MARFIISVLLLLAALAAAILMESGNPLAYVGLTAFVIEVLVPFFAMLAVWRLAEIGGAFRDAFSAGGDAAHRARSVRVWAFTEKVCYAAGIIGLIIGIILVLGRVSGAVDELGRALGMALIAPLYGIFLGVICRILKARVER